MKINSKASTGVFQKSKTLLGDCIFNKLNDQSSEVKCMSISSSTQYC